MGAGNVKGLGSFKKPPKYQYNSPPTAHKTITNNTAAAAAAASTSPSSPPPFNQSNSYPPTSPLKKWTLTTDEHRTAICRFCGGKSCRREDYTKQKDTPAVVGLHSTWISSSIIGIEYS